MADLTITAANVGVGDQTTITRLVQVGEAVTQGQPLYQLASDGKYYEADANDAAKDAAEGIAITSASTNGYAIMATKNKVNLGATLTVGTIYVVSDTVGGIMPAADLFTGDYVTILGVASTAALLDLQITVSGTVTP